MLELCTDPQYNARNLLFYNILFFLSSRLYILCISVFLLWIVLNVETKVEVGVNGVILGYTLKF